MSLAVNIPSKLFQDEPVDLEINLPKQKVQLLTVSVCTHTSTNTLHFFKYFFNQASQIHTPFCPVTNSKSFRFLPLLLAYFLSLLNLQKQNKTKTTFFVTSHYYIAHFPFSVRWLVFPVLFLNNRNFKK